MPKTVAGLCAVALATGAAAQEAPKAEGRVGLGLGALKPASGQGVAFKPAAQFSFQVYFNLEGRWVQRLRVDFSGRAGTDARTGFLRDPHSTSLTPVRGEYGRTYSAVAYEWSSELGPKRKVFLILGLGLNLVRDEARLVATGPSTRPQNQSRSVPPSHAPARVWVPRPAWAWGTESALVGPWNGATSRPPRSVATAAATSTPSVEAKTAPP